MITFKQLFSEALVKMPGTQYGSNEGGLHQDDQTGEKFYVKHYDNPDQGKVEALTGKIYDHMGIKTVNPTSDASGTVSTKWNPNLKQMKRGDFEKLNGHQQNQIGRMYHAATLTKNWDILGLVHDNVVKDSTTHDLHAIDHGGAFHFRAQGGPKPYGPDIAEHDSLRNSPGNASSHVFSTVFRQNPAAEHEGLKAVEHMDMSHIHGLFKNSGLSNWQSLHDNFKARRTALLGKYGKQG